MNAATEKICSTLKKQKYKDNPVKKSSSWFTLVIGLLIVYYDQTTINISNT